MSIQATVRVRWDFTESHEALIPVDELAEALAVAVDEFSPAMLTGTTTTEGLVILLGRYQDEDSHQYSDTRQITDAQPGPPSVDELLRAADRLLEAERSAVSLGDVSRLLAQLVTAVREQRSAG